MSSLCEHTDDVIEAGLELGRHGVQVADRHGGFDAYLGLERGPERISVVRPPAPVPNRGAFGHVEHHAHAGPLALPTAIPIMPTNRVNQRGHVIYESEQRATFADSK